MPFWTDFLAIFSCCAMVTFKNGVSHEGVDREAPDMSTFEIRPIIATFTSEGTFDMLFSICMSKLKQLLRFALMCLGVCKYKEDCLINVHIPQLCIN